MQLATLNNFVIVDKTKRIGFLINFLSEKVNENANLLLFQIDSVINVTKNGETKICKAVQELKNLVKQNDGIERSSDRSKTSEQSKFTDREYFGGGKKWKKTLISSQPRKRKYEVKNIKL